LDHRMAPILDEETRALIDDGTDVAALRREAREGREHVDLGDGLRDLLILRDLRRGCLAELEEALVLDLVRSLARVEDLVLVVLELGGDETLAVLERLLAEPIVRHLVAMRVRHLEVVAENLVVADLEARDSRALALRLLKACEPALALPRDLPELVELGIVPWT